MRNALVGRAGDVSVLVDGLVRSRKDVGEYALGDMFRGFLDGVATEMGMARGRLHVAVNEVPADDRQAFAERQRPGRRGVM